MSTNVIQANYEQLEQLATRFSQQAESATELRNAIRQAFAPLEDGGWIGRGAEAFFAEMHSEIFPALERLITALREAQSVTRAIMQIMQSAEEEAAQPFRQMDAREMPVGEGTTSDGARKESPGLWDRIGGAIHTTLDVAGLVPGIGEIADGVNAAIYVAEGDILNAAISAAGMIPGAGTAATGGRLAAKAGRELVEEAAEKGARELVEEAAEKGTRDIGQRLAQEGRQVRGNFPKTADGNSILYRADESGKVTHYQMYDSDGLPIKRVDITGKPHGGVPTPHVVEYSKHVAPDGSVFLRKSREVRAATPDELP